jgi:polyphosphate kinase 2 (PPK2 family)
LEAGTADEAAGRQELARLEQRLGELQREARTAGVPVVVVFEGLAAAGKGTCINRLTQALDPRGFKVWSIQAPTEEERLRPFLWRFWTKLPPAGAIAIFDRSWYGRVLADRVEHRVARKRWLRAYEQITTFERQLAGAGAVLVKFWLHVDRDVQERRLKRMSQGAEAWRVTDADWRQHKQHDRYMRAAADMRARTDTSAAPWTVVDGGHRRAARAGVLHALIGALELALAGRISTAGSPARPAASEADLPVGGSPPAAIPASAGEPSQVEALAGTLTGVSPDRPLARGEYDKTLRRLQRRLRELEHLIYVRRVPVVIVYEGADGAGKGGSIKRLTQRLDPRGYEVIPVAAPTAEERAYHYLWRFWRDLPKDGHITIFDRSWYGRVLVERIEGFCAPQDWQRAYGEINEFEAELVQHGTVLIKFWLHIDADEQLQRFRERQETPWKTWKLTEEDWRNREKWAQYQAAVGDMLRFTSTPRAPWTVVPANDKLRARITTLAAVAGAIEAALSRS